MQEKRDSMPKKEKKIELQIHPYKFPHPNLEAAFLDTNFGTKNNK